MNTRPLVLIHRLTNYIFPSIQASFKSEYTLEESINRLRDITDHNFFKICFSERPQGHVDIKRVKLQRQIPFFRNSFKPTFIGNFIEHEAGVSLEGKFTTFSFTKIFGLAWFIFCATWTIIALSKAISATLATSQPASFFNISIIFMLVPIPAIILLGLGILIARVSWRISIRDIDYLKHIITKALTK